MAEQSFTVTGMRCGGCASTIETGLRCLAGVRRVVADPDIGVVRVRFDAQRLDADAVAARLKRLGFPLAGAGGGA